MKQETGETRDAIIEDDEKRIEQIVSLNIDRRDPYWIVLFAKPSRQSVDGKPTLLKHIKHYFTKPTPQVGMVVGEVCNQKGTIQWDINMPQRPFDFNGLIGLGAEITDELVVETTSIPGAYITK